MGWDWPNVLCFVSIFQPHLRKKFGTEKIRPVLAWAGTGLMFSVSFQFSSHTYAKNLEQTKKIRPVLAWAGTGLMFSVSFQFFSHTYAKNLEQTEKIWPVLAQARTDLIFSVSFQFFLAAPTQKFGTNKED